MICVVRSDVNNEATYVVEKCVFGSLIGVEFVLWI